MNETSPNYPDQPSFRRRRQRRVLIGLATVATLIALFYLAEDWRGKQAWASFKKAVETRGEVFDWSTRIPPPVPDGQNFFNRLFTCFCPNYLSAPSGKFMLKFQQALI